MRGRVQVGRVRKGDMMSSGVRRSPHGLAGPGRRAADMRLHTAHVVMSKCTLNSVEMRQRATAARDACRRKLARLRASLGFSDAR